MSWYLKVLKNYAVFKGRARRKEYWMFTLFYVIFFIVAMILDRIIGTTIGNSGYGIISMLYLLANFIPGLAVVVRRLHDIAPLPKMAPRSLKATGFSESKKFIYFKVPT